MLALVRMVLLRVGSGKMLLRGGDAVLGTHRAYEVKFDGVRAVGYAGRGGLRLYSRNDRDISRSYPEIAALELGKGVVVDGELIALDEPRSATERSS